MKRLLFLLLLIPVLSFGQEVTTYSGKALTYGLHVLTRPFSPADIDGLEFWYDGNDESSFTLDGTSVDQWDDKSKNDRHVINSNGDATRPSYNSTTGRVTFTTANSTYLQSSSFTGLSQPNTVFIACKLNSHTTNNQHYFDGSTSIATIYATSSKFRVYAGGVLEWGDSDGDDNIHVIEFNGASSDYWINGSLTTGNAGTANFNQVTIGARGFGPDLFADVEIMEVIGYSDELSDDDRIAVTDYLSRKWTITMLASITIIGNSLSVPAPLTWVDKVETDVYTMTNYAAGGASIMADMDAQTVSASANYADIFIVFLGTNDNNGGDMAALQSEYEENLLELITAQPLGEIYCVNVLPRWTDSGGGTEVDKSNLRTAIAAACAAQGATCWDTYSTPWIEASDTYDGLHTTSPGAEKIWDEIKLRL